MPGRFPNRSSSLRVAARPPMPPPSTTRRVVLAVGPAVPNVSVMPMPPGQRGSARALQVPLLEEELPRLGIVALVRQLPPEGVSETVVRVEQVRDVECVADG